MYRLTFNQLHDYDPASDSITIPVELKLAGTSVKAIAKLDTGARCCIFQRELGELLGIEIDRGQLKEFVTAKGTFQTYGHDLTLAALGYDIDTTVYFASEANFPRNVLGRTGWIERFRLGIVDYDGRLYVSHYDDL